MMTLKQSSTLADRQCLIYSSVHAKLYLDSEQAHLVRVKYKNNEKHFCWVDSVIKPQAICCAFIGDDAEDLFSFKIEKEIRANEVFCFNGDAFYLDKAENNHLTIRYIKVLSSERIVEQITAYDNEPEPVESIYPVNIYKIHNGLHYITTGWGVYRESFLEYLPVFVEDEDLFGSDFADESLGAMAYAPVVRKELKSGYVFRRDEYIYKFLTDEKGKMFLSRLPLYQHLRLGGRQQQKPSNTPNESGDAEKLAEKKKDKQKVKIIPLRQY